MTQAALLAVVLLATGAFALRWTTRLAPLTSELPLKTAAALAASAWALAVESGLLAGAPNLVTVALAFAAVVVTAPMVLSALARAGRYRAAEHYTDALFWTGAARTGLRRLLATVALHRYDHDAAERLLPEDAAALRAALWARTGRLEALLDETFPPEPARSDPESRARIEAARILALTEAQRTDEAERRLAALQQLADTSADSPTVHAALRLSQARLAAARGRVQETQAALDPAPLGLPAHEGFALLARAADVARHPAAAELWGRAYQAAPSALRPRYRERATAAGGTPPKVRPQQPVGTYALTGVLVAAYGAQLAVDAWGAPFATPLGRLDPAQAVGAFLLGIPGVPGGDAWWRFLSYAFVHGNLLHIGLNAWVGFDLGRILEGRRHWGDLLGAFVGGTVMGGYLVSVAQAGQTVVLVGASGGVLGVAGALWADVLRGKGAADRALSRSLMIWMGMIFLLSVAVPGVSLWGHAGGVVGGLLYGFARQGVPREVRWSRWAGRVAILAMVAAVAAMVATAVRILA